MLRKMTISARLGATLFFLCLALAISGALGVYGTVKNHQVTNQIVEDGAEVIVIGKINVKVFDSRLHIAQARLNTDPDNLAREGRVIAENNQQTLADLAELQRLALNTGHSAAVGTFVKTVSDFVENYLAPVEKALLAGDTEQLDALKPVGDKFYSPIKQSRNDLMKSIDDSTQGKRQNAAETYQQTLWLITAVVGLGIVLAAVLGGLVLRTISKDTSELLTAMLYIQREHDLTQRLPVKSEDELGKIAQAVNGLLESIHKFAHSVRNQSENNIDATRMLLSKAEAVSESAQQQSQLASTASQHLQGIVENIQSISRRASDTRELTASSTLLGQQGGEVVKGTAAEMAKVAHQVQIAANDIRELDKQSAEIDAIVSAISDIADQTNLLALNAAIESARAGESGRGFAVVADEVRKLAERTRHFTGEIQKTISTIRQETASAAACMESGRVLAEQGVSTAEKAAEMITEIQNAIESINAAVTDITTTVGNQEASTDSVARQIDTIAALCRENATSAESSRELAAQTESSSKSLASAANAFRV